MRRLITWIVVSLGIAALVKRFRRRRQEEIATAPPEEPDPAAELRQKLADSRADGEDEIAEPPLSPEASIDERRASVHEQGRAAADEMRGSDAD